VQRPAAQLLDATFAALQARAHPPQLPMSAVVLISHPSAESALQSPNPVSQLATTHLLALQASTAFCRLQTAPQAPQLLTLFVTLTSQPFTARLSQLANPVLQVATVHTPAAQLDVALGRLQTYPHVPQFAASV
jgi:hypothetical protein